MSASSMPHCCSGLTRPTSSPRRPASTAPTCSTRIRVFSPSRSISGRKDAGRALRDVGATRTTDLGKNSLAWTTTPNRRPRCSCPRPRGIRNSWMSPRSTQTLHHNRDFQHFLPITLVGFERGDLLGERFAPLQAGGAIDDRPADRLGPAQSGRFKLVQRAQRFVVQAQTNRNSHKESVSRFVIHDLSSRWASSPRATGSWVSSRLQTGRCASWRSPWPSTRTLGLSACRQLLLSGRPTRKRSGCFLLTCGYPLERAKGIGPS